ncbi:cytochrome P450 [Streptomyces sp. NRRL F-5727]|uniref:cytochrome P450 n=1 Tax=Streptomyces sp. NRRL F-5727 TaxID=1463871 RepID=UPI000691D7B6|nr:cytochrome P450 [Streptomyces sp. NRRL F-5727]
MTRTAVPKLADTDLTDPVVHAERDLRPLWRHLRRHRPVAHHATPDGRGFWVVTPHQLVEEVCVSAERFTSVRGNTLGTLLAGGDPAGGGMLAVSDGPRHRSVHRELMRAFTAQALAPYRERIVARIDGLVRAAVARGEADFAREVARPIPMAAVCDMLGVPEGDREALYADASHTLASETPVTDDVSTRLARQEILLYFARLVRSLRGEPGDDLLGLLVRMTESEIGLTEDELLYNCYSLLLGGEETTRYTMSGTVQALADHPDQWRRLVRGEVALDTAVEELLRWTTAPMHVGRTAVRDTELGGVRIAEGDIVTAWISAANDDETTFDEPRRLDLGRTPNRHLAFLRGPHTCPGARLVRIEMTALLTALVTHADGWEITGRAVPVYSTFMQGLSSLPVRFVPRVGPRPRPPKHADDAE